MVAADHRLSVYDNVQLSASDGGSDAKQTEVEPEVSSKSVLEIKGQFRYLQLEICGPLMSRFLVNPPGESSDGRREHFLHP